MTADSRSPRDGKHLEVLGYYNPLPGQDGGKRMASILKFEKYDPNSDPNISGDPYKTLLVARLNYETTESRIKREFEAYGPIKREITQKWGSGYVIWLLRLSEDESRAVNQMFVILSDVWLDDDERRR